MSFRDDPNSTGGNAGSSSVASGSRSRRADGESYFDMRDDEADDEVYDLSGIDPALRLRTTRTAHSVIAESIQIESAQERRKRRRKELISSLKRRATLSTKTGINRAASIIGSADGSGRARSSTLGGASQVSTEFGGPTTIPGGSRRGSVSTPADTTAAPKKTLAQRISDVLNGKAGQKAPERRTIYINLPLPAHLLHNGIPIVRYVRNKVRTSKYTLVTFIPKNLFEQFRRVANIYFLGLVILQLFPIFGAPNGQIGMLPLLAILGMTAIKDGIEDWRRATQDNEVNNSATTKLGGWRNVNQPVDSRNFLERLLRIGPDPQRVSKGVRKLRENEASAGKRIVMEAQKGQEEIVGDFAFAAESESGHGHHLTDYMQRAPSTASVMSKRSGGVLDWTTHAPGTAGWERTLWKKLEVGDIVLLQENEQVPADIIVLSTSNADHLCFVETKNLDGETNLKVRRSLKGTCAITSEEALEHAHFVIDSEPPHANLYNYNGVLRHQEFGDKAGEMKQEAVTINELLLRGCSLRNTKWVIGLVVFTGADTKIMINGGDTPSKRSKIEKETNFNVIMNFALLMVLCLLTAILHGWYQSLPNASAEFYEPGAQVSENIVLGAVIIFFSCLIVFQNIVPISLYITIEIVKTIQAYFIFQDIEMYYDVYDTPCVPKTWNISDDLGQIEYVFSDKTGTLTQNIMEFKKCSIRGVSFGEGMTEAMMGAAKRDGRDIGVSMDDQADELGELKDRMLETMKPAVPNRYLREDQLTLISPDLALRMANRTDPLRPHIVDFFRALAVCHTVLSDTPDDSKPFVLDYKAESPDEAALVAAARDVGFPFINRNNDRIDIECLGQAERWTPLRVLEFNSTRKRMSVIARAPDGRIVLFCKGADSVIYERLRNDHDEQLKQSTMKDLETFANGGLRTLCIASRDLSESEFSEWARVYDAASAAVKDREGEIERACEKIEHSLQILGATALEDKLQEGVPDAIATLHQAGIKLWILTGDKLQTAIEIGYSCNLLTNDMEVMIISTDSADGARSQIEAGLNKIASMRGPPPIVKRGQAHSAPDHGPTFAVVIDGESLRYALTPELKSLFLSLGTQCAAVICCRVSPSQKALTVRLVKEGCNAMTLAIGDGANDVAMIQEANIGVGLFGLEGSQAAMSADYAFGQFRFLTRLLLVHGRWSYVRVADMHANFFYKNVIWTISMFWFLIFNSFDATYLFEYTLLLFYNLFFTSLPVAVLGIFDQDTNARASMAFPQLYKPGIAGREYTRTRFWLYMLDGLYQSAALFFIPWAAYGGGTTWSNDGLDTNSLYDLGTVVACAGVIAANMYVGVNNRYWTVLTFIIIIGSTLLVYIWIPIYSILNTGAYRGVLQISFPNFTFWAVTILTVFVCVGPRWLVRSFKCSYLPRDKDIIREAWIAGDLKDQLGLQHRRRRRKKGAKGRQGDGKDWAGSGMGTGTGTGDSTPPEDDGSPDFSNGAIERFTDDNRGFYKAAAIASPMRGGSINSEDGSIRGGFTYPPSSPQVHPSPQITGPSQSLSLSTPTKSRTSYVSGTAPLPANPYSSHPTSPVEAYHMTASEIQRMSRNSADLGRAVGDSQVGSGSPGVARVSSSRRHSRQNPASPPISRLTLPGDRRNQANDQQYLGRSSQRPSFEMLEPDEGRRNRMRGEV